jgi:hypothetical protein
MDAAAHYELHLKSPQKLTISYEAKEKTSYEENDGKNE